ncbi:MAG: alpha/beta fold hydrolase [Myxococcales bacterium]|nr:alpha/beta fold hydrolase [Myxococcales bacterium]
MSYPVASVSRALAVLCVLTSACLASCGDEALPPLPEDPATTLGVAAGRPADIRVPRDYDARQAYPLVVLLHGFSASGGVQNIYFGLSNQVTELGFILVVPDGTPNSDGQRFWNATDACCNFEGSSVDDVAYIRALIEEASANYRVDPRRVYLFGHSNGGFMSYRMACEAPDVITAIASLAGATFEDPADCVSDEPVSVLQIHGTADEVILYDGATDANGMFPAGYPGALESVRRSAARAGCDVEAAVAGADLDLDNSLDGAETQVLDFRAGCDPGLDMSLWSIEDGGHLPVVDRVGFSTAVLEWLLRHERR